MVEPARRVLDELLEHRISRADQEATALEPPALPARPAIRQRDAARAPTGMVAKVRQALEESKETAVGLLDPVSWLRKSSELGRYLRSGAWGGALGGGAPFVAESVCGVVAPGFDGGSLFTAVSFLGAIVGAMYAVDSVTKRSRKARAVEVLRTLRPQIEVLKVAEQKATGVVAQTRINVQVVRERVEVLVSQCDQAPRKPKLRRARDAESAKLERLEGFLDEADTVLTDIRGLSAAAHAEVKVHEEERKGA